MMGSILANMRIQTSEHVVYIQRNITDSQIAWNGEYANLFFEKKIAVAILNALTQ